MNYQTHVQWTPAKINFQRGNRIFIFNIKTRRESLNCPLNPHHVLSFRLRVKIFAASANPYSRHSEGLVPPCALSMARPLKNKVGRPGLLPVACAPAAARHASEE